MRSHGSNGSEQRQAIIARAVETIREKGIAGLTVRALARRLGCSPATFYLYFTNKRSLLGEVARVGFHQLQERIEAAASENDPLEALSGLAQAYLAFAREDPELHRLMFPPDAHPLAERRRFFQVTRGVMQRGIEAGKLRGSDAQPMALAFGCMLRGIQQLESSERALGVAGSGDLAPRVLEEGLSLLQA